MKCIIIVMVSIPLLVMVGIAILVLGVFVAIDNLGTDITDPRTIERMQLDLNPSFTSQWSSDGSHLFFNLQDAKENQTHIVDSKGLNLRTLFSYGKRYDGSLLARHRT